MGSGLKVLRGDLILTNDLVFNPVNVCTAFIAISGVQNSHCSWYPNKKNGLSIFDVTKTLNYLDIRIYMRLIGRRGFILVTYMAWFERIGITRNPSRSDARWIKGSRS